MTSRLFHAVVACGAALGLLPIACVAEPLGIPREDAGTTDSDAKTADRDPSNRCSLPGGGCNEHCSTLGDGSCLDPCFVHTTTCSPDCVRLDGSCGWPPTK